MLEKHKTNSDEVVSLLQASQSFPGPHVWCEHTGLGGISG
jgi:hypothetical protein